MQLEFVETVTSSGYSLWCCTFISVLQALMLFERWLNKTTSVYPSPHSFHCVVLRIHLLVPWSVYSGTDSLSVYVCLSTRRAHRGSYASMRRSSLKCPWLLSWLRTCRRLMCWHVSLARTGTETHIHTRTRLSHAFTSPIAYFFTFCPLRSLVVKREDLSLYEIGGNISKCGFTIFSIYVCHYFVCWVK